MSEELLSTEQAAKRMNRSVQWIQYLVKENKLPAMKVGRTYVIKASDVDSYEHQPRGKPSAAKAEAHNTTVAPEPKRAKQAKASSRKHS